MRGQRGELITSFVVLKNTPQFWDLFFEYSRVGNLDGDGLATTPGGREFAEAGYCGRDDLEGFVDLFFGGEAGEGEADAGSGAGGREAHGGENVGGFGGSGLAGRASADREAL